MESFSYKCECGMDIHTVCTYVAKHLKEDWPLVSQ